MPEQVQENAANIKVLDAAIGKIAKGTMIGKNLWTNATTTEEFEAQVITNDELLNPYNVIKVYIINDIGNNIATIQSVMLDLDVNYPVYVDFIDGTTLHRRMITFNSSKNEIEISNESIIDLLTSEVSSGTNNYLVPLALIGFIEQIEV